MDELLTEYFLMKNDLDCRLKTIEKLRDKIKTEMNEKNLKKYENKNCSVNVSKGNRTSLNKKDVPKDVWEKYSTCTPYEMLQIKKKSTSTIRSDIPKVRKY